jgi:hypothetical protein
LLFKSVKPAEVKELLEHLALYRCPFWGNRENK